MTKQARRHRTLAVTLAGFAAFLSLYATQPLLPALAHAFGSSNVGVSLTVTAATAGVALSAPLIGMAADRIGRKRVIVCAALLAGVSTLLAATAHRLDVLILWRFLQGIFTPGIFVVTVAYIQEEWAGGGTGHAMSAYVTGTVLGGFSGRFVSGLVAERWDWHASFVVLGGIGLLCALLIWRHLPPERRFVVHPRHESQMAAAVDHVRNRRLLATFAAGFCVLFSLLGAFTWVTFHLAAPPFHLNSAALGSLFFVYLVGAAVTPFCGRWIDRHGHRLSVVASISLAVAGLLLTLAGRIELVVAGLALTCTGVFTAQSAANSYIGLAAAHSKALAVGLYVTCYYAGGSAGAFVPGYLWQLGGWPACVALFVAVQALTIVIALAWWTAPSAEEDQTVVETLTSA